MCVEMCLQMQILVRDICAMCWRGEQRQREPRQALRLERLKLHPVVLCCCGVNPHAGESTQASAESPRQLKECARLE